MSASDTTEIRSYRTVFDLERRIYRIDQLRLNPGGIPVRGVIYFIAMLVLALLAGVAPVTSIVVKLLPWYIRDLALPAGCAALLTIIRVEGRPFHLAARALLRYACGPRHLSGLRPCPPLGTRWRPADLLVLPDGSDARLRRMRFSGPGAAMVSVAHERAVWNGGLFRKAATVTLRPLARSRALKKGQVIELPAGVSLQIKTGPCASPPAGPPQRRQPHRSSVQNVNAGQHAPHKQGARYRWGYG
jgi:hypothetical protein